MPLAIPVKPVDPITIQVLREVSTVARRFDAEFMLVGATARDVLLESVHGIPPSRRTRDIDLAIALEGWDAFYTLRADLIATRRFEASDQIQRLRYRLSANKHLPVDLLPFGGIEQRAGTLAWPPDLAVVMNVFGFPDAMREAISVRLAPDLEVAVASLAGIALLKILAWIDRGSENPKDAVDLAEILRRYADAGNSDRLYEEAVAALESVDYDPQRAGMWLLGKDVAALASDATRGKVIAVLEEPRQHDRLAQNMISDQPVHEDAYLEAKRSLDIFRNGLLARA